MAIDTAAKRSSALDHEEVWQAGIPLPDGTISQADRQHLAHSYSGILAAPAFVFAGLGQRRAFRASKRENADGGRRRTHRVPPDADLDAEG